MNNRLVIPVKQSVCYPKKGINSIQNCRPGTNGNERVHIGRRFEKAFHSFNKIATVVVNNGH